MLLSMKDEAEINLNAKENDFMLDNSFRDETLEELTAAVIMMDQIQPAGDNAVTEPTYDANAVSEVNASHKAHKQVNHVKRKTIIHVSDDDQIDSNIIFDDPYVKNNTGTSEHDSNDHDEYHNIQIMAYNIIMVNVIPPDHVNDVPIVEPNQHDDVLVVPEPVLVDEDEDPKEDKFEEEEDPQEEEDDMEVDIEEDENKPKLTYPYEEVDPLNPLSPAFELEPEDAIEVENPIEHEDETVLASVYEVGESSTAPFLREDSDRLLPGLMRRDINSFFVRSSVVQVKAVMEKLVEKLGNTEDKVECKKLKKELEEGRPNEAINVSIEDKKSPSSESRGSPRDS
ncbi:hypothetical protein Tco_0502916 [Tanacetum coccineum]